MQHKPSARERVIASAKQLFSERGFHRTAIADLAEDAQVSVGGIYRCFANKSAIIRAIVDDDTAQTLEQLRSEIEKVRTGAAFGAEVVERLVFQWLSRRVDALNHEIVAEGHRNPEVAEVIRAVCTEFREQLRTLVKLLQPDMEDGEVEGAAELLLACLFGMGNRQFTQPRLDEGPTAAIVAQLFLKGLGNRNSHAPERSHAAPEGYCTNPAE